MFEFLNKLSKDPKTRVVHRTDSEDLVIVGCVVLTQGSACQTDGQTDTRKIANTDVCIASCAVRRRISDVCIFYTDRR